VVTCKDEEMFIICESIVVIQVYELILKAKDYITLKGSILNYPDELWLDYFYD
jgi:hypothetical protein